MVEILYLNGTIEKISKLVLKGFLIVHKNEVFKINYL